MKQLKDFKYILEVIYKIRSHSEAYFTEDVRRMSPPLVYSNKYLRVDKIIILKITLKSYND